ERMALKEAAPGDRARYEGCLRRIESMAESFRDGTARARRESLATLVTSLEREVVEQPPLKFDDFEDEWWNTHLAQLEQDLLELQRRIAVAERSVRSPEAVQAWNEAIEAIAQSPKYGGLRISPQLELLPIGPDQESGLWEFAHLGTGEPAVRA